jgi:polyisoprenoid-binding protein YceI
MNNKNILIMGGAVLIAAAAGLGWWGYDAVLGETEAATSPITAVPLVVSQATSVAEATDTTEAATEVTTNTTAASDVQIFEIAQSNSVASFNIYEELAGTPTDVIGTTDQVAGQIAINLADLSQTEVGVIQVNARTLATDNDRRNNAIKNFILSTDQYEFITFTPTEITGLSGSAEPGQAVTFQVAGNLTIKDVTQPVVFELTVQGDSANQLTGTATAVIQRSDYGLSIPSVPNVANVGEEVTIEINFVAQAAA